jgi:hypothetical protein
MILAALVLLLQHLRLQILQILAADFVDKKGRGEED